MSKVIEVTDQNFEEQVLESDLPIEVDFAGGATSHAFQINFKKEE